MKTFGIVIGSLVAIVLLSLFIQGNDWFVYKVFAPRYESVRRETYEQSKAYNTGMVQELQNMQFDYEKTTDSKAKAALASIILHRSADYPVEKMPTDLRTFIESLKNEQSGSKY